MVGNTDVNAALSVDSPTNRIADLGDPRPRIIASDRSFSRVTAHLDADPYVADWYDQIANEAENILEKPPKRYPETPPKRLLPLSRSVLDTVWTLGAMYRLTGDERYAERGWTELQAIAAYPDWHPSHFLDTAEMTTAAAVGYDWFHDYLNDRQRRVIRGAIVGKGIREALRAYRGAIEDGEHTVAWPDVEHNWNTVCNGGIAMGALAIGIDEPRLKDEIDQVIGYARESLSLPVSAFGDDGSWDEGITYWHYNVRYLVYLLTSTLESLDSDFGIRDRCSVANTGRFPVYLSGPRGAFNFGDAGQSVERHVSAPELFVLARWFDQPELADHQRSMVEREGPSPLDLLWYDPNCIAPRSQLPRSARIDDISTFRSDWEDPSATFVACKSGENQVNHGDLDAGSFVMDALGVRWAVDLGADDYNLPGYWDMDLGRWQYYRKRAEGHNTLVIGRGSDPDQNPYAETEITRFQAEDDAGFTVMDLTDAYPEADSVTRGIGHGEGGQNVLVQDELDVPTGATVRWFMHTGANVNVNGNTAVLTQDNRKLWVRVLEPSGATFDLEEAEPSPGSPDPEMQASNDDVTRLAITLDGSEASRIAVLLVPVDPRTKAKPPGPVRVLPLEQWSIDFFSSD